jgi:hypothetical protein
MNNNDSKIAAEKLLRSVLPEDLCVSLSAIGMCEVQGKKHLYKIFKNSKTHCIQGDRIFSCCIHLSDSAAPDTDRIVAEYLLIKNSESEYLNIANLTEITTRRSRGGEALEALWDNAGHQFDAARYLMGVDQARVGDTIRVQRPARYEPRPLNQRLTTSEILMIALDLMSRHERMLGLRFRLIPYDEYRRLPGLNFQHYYVDLTYDDEALMLSAGDFAQRYLRLAVFRLVDLLLEPGFLVRTFCELPIPGGLEQGGRASNPENGISLRLTSAYSLVRNGLLTRLDAAVIREPIGG